MGEKKDGDENGVKTAVQENEMFFSAQLISVVRSPTCRVCKPHCFFVMMSMPELGNLTAAARSVRVVVCCVRARKRRFPFVS